MSRSENLGVYTIHHTPAGDGTTENYTITKTGSGSVTLIEDTDSPGVFKADPETVPNSWMGPVELMVGSGPAYEFKTGSLPLTVTIGEGEDAKTYNYTYTITESGVPEMFVVSYAMNGQSATPGATFTDNGGTIINRTFNGVELPSTGGPGTHFFYIIGCILTMFAGAGIVMKRRRR